MTDNTFMELAQLQAAIEFAGEHGDKATGADLLLRVREIGKAVKKLEDGCKAIFADVQRDNGWTIDGLACRLTVNQKVDWRFQTKAVKVEMGEPWYDARCSQVTSNRFLTLAI